MSPCHIRVRKGTGRSHRINLALDRLHERQGPTTLRLVLQAHLPRGQERPSRLEYQRVGSYLVDCGSPEALARVREALGSLMQTLTDQSVAPPTQEPSPRPDPTLTEVDPGLQKVLRRFAEIRGELPKKPARETRPSVQAPPPPPTPLTIEERDPWFRLRLF